MSKFFISGLINIESSLNIGSFPINYCPIEYPFNQINTSVSGVGFNIAKALKTLNQDFDLFSIVGNDVNGLTIKSQLKIDNICADNLIITDFTSTAESLVLYDQNGQRKIYCDLKNLQNQDFSIEKYIKNIKDYGLAILTNINFNRPLIELFKTNNIEIATDVHILSNPYDEYNKRFMENATYLFLSNEGCLNNEGNFMKEIYNIYHNKLIVMGCGSEGALVYEGEKNQFYYEKAVAPYGIKNTVGAGDSLFSSFLYFYKKSKDIQKSLRFAVFFAGIKISSSGGAVGFPKEEEVIKFLNC